MELPPPPAALISSPRRRIVPPAVTTSDEDTSERSYFSDDSPTGYSETRGSRRNSQPNENNSESEESGDRRYRDIYHEVWEYINFELEQLFNEPQEEEDLTDVFETLYNLRTEEITELEMEIPPTFMGYTASESIIQFLEEFEHF